MQISNNLASLDAYNQININLNSQNNALNKISSGLKITKAADDPNGLIQSQSFNLQVRGLQMAQNNLQSGVSMLQTADGGLSSISDTLNRMRDLTVQAGGVTSSDDKNAIQGEIDQLSKSINDAVNNTSFNGVNLLDGSSSDPMNLAIGSNSGESISIPKNDLTTNDSTLLGSFSAIDINANGTDSSLETIDAAISKVSVIRSNYGAIENRLQSTSDSNAALTEVSQSAESNITDADMAEEITNYNKFNVLAQAGEAIMAQTNKLPQDVLKMLQNVL